MRVHKSILKEELPAMLLNAPVLKDKVMVLKNHVRPCRGWHWHGKRSSRTEQCT